ncbi:MAG: lipid A-modifier LpxR family protein, partial [Desulfatiglandales bacterium]
MEATPHSKKGFLVCLFVTLFVFPDGLLAAEKDPLDHWTFTFYLENDVFTGTDREYTNGTKLTWISQDLRNYREDPRVPEWSYPIIEHLPFVNKPGFQRNISLSIGQNMYAPEDLERTDLIPEERPYA